MSKESGSITFKVDDFSPKITGGEGKPNESEENTKTPTEIFIKEHDHEICDRSKRVQELIRETEEYFLNFLDLADRAGYSKNEAFLSAIKDLDRRIKKLIETHEEINIRDMLTNFVKIAGEYMVSLFSFGYGIMEITEKDQEIEKEMEERGTNSGIDITLTPKLYYSDARNVRFNNLQISSELSKLCGKLNEIARLLDPKKFLYIDEVRESLITSNEGNIILRTRERNNVARLLRDFLQSLSDTLNEKFDLSNQ